MVVEYKRAVPRQARDVINAHMGIIEQEMYCFKRSLTLEPILVSDLAPRFSTSLLYPLFISLQIFFISVLFNMLGSSKTIGLFNFSILFGIIFAYCYIAGYAFKYFLSKQNDSSVICYAYVCAYSMTYITLAMLISLLLGPLGSILMFAFVLVSQYFITNCLLVGYEFDSNKKRFLFSIMLLVVQFIFIIGLQSFVVYSTVPAPK